MAGRVFVVGAGASRSDSTALPFPIPLATEFFDSRYLAAFWPDGPPTLLSSSLWKVLAQYFGVSRTKRRAPSVLPNVEEVYSFVDVASGVYRSQLDNRTGMAAARSELLAYVSEVIRRTADAVANPELHASIVTSLDLDDTIITFNWDLLFDVQLEKTAIGRELLLNARDRMDPPPVAADQPYELVAEPFRTNGMFIKLHGSVNLAQCSNTLCRRHQAPFWFSDPEQILYGWPCIECGGRLEVMLVPPHIHKTYRGNRYLSLLASIAARRLSRATEIIVVGYSFPAFDFEAQAMFRMARLEPWEVGPSLDYLNQVTIVDPRVTDPTYVNRVRDLLGLKGKKAHGGKVKLVTYDSVASYLTP